MAHIHEKVDWAVAVFVVQQQRVLLVHHRNLKQWLPVGGHVELDEDPETAALRETLEESGLEVELLGERPPTTGGGTKALITPRFLDQHHISDTHQHVCLIYFARPRNGTVTLAEAEHHAIQWCSREDLDRLNPPIAPSVRWYCEKALAEVRD